MRASWSASSRPLHPCWPGCAFRRVRGSTNNRSSHQGSPSSEHRRSPSFVVNRHRNQSGVNLSLPLERPIGASSRWDEAVRARRLYRRGRVKHGATGTHGDTQMATSAEPRAVTQSPKGAMQRPADVLVVFGITGDLAKVMTFRSLYRLEQRGLLDCPIVGVAVDDWTRRPAARACPRRAIEAPARSSTTRCSTASRRGCRTSAATSPTRRRTQRVGDAIDGRRNARCSTSRSRRCSSARWSRACATPG